MRILFFHAVLFAVASIAHALTWEKTSLNLTIEAGSGNVIAEFPFTNEGATQVTITELKSNCGCTAPTVKSKVISAGGADVLKVVYALGNRVGPQNIQVIVRTDEAGRGPAIINLRIDIQPLISITPRMVHWTKADGPITRVIDIKQLAKSPVRLGEIKTTDDALAVELKSGAESGVWQLSVIPKSVEIPFTTKVEIPIIVGERVTTYSVFAIAR